MAAVVRLNKQPFLFKEMRARKPKAAPEFARHCVLVDLIRLSILDGWRWTHLPFGEYRTPATAGKLKRMGVDAGWFDFCFLSPAGQVFFVELKAPDGVLSDNQRRMRRFLRSAGIPFLVSSSIDEIMQTLRSWGALKDGVRW